MSTSGASIPTVMMIHKVSFIINMWCGFLRYQFSQYSTIIHIIITVYNKMELV